jgi:hypothetical protein
MHIWLRGTAARVALLVMAVVGFVLAMGDVLDLYVVLWKFTLPGTLVYAVLLWCFVLAEPRDEPQTPVVVKLAMLLVLLLTTLGAVALAWDLYGLVARNWPMILLAFALLAVIFGWTFLTTRKAPKSEPKPRRDRRDDLVS